MCAVEGAVLWSLEMGSDTIEEVVVWALRNEGMRVPLCTLPRMQVITGK